MSIIIQQLTIKWSKAGRTPEEAALRNRLPTKLPLPALPAEEGIYAHTAGLYTQAKATTSPLRTLTAEQLRDYGFLIEEEGEMLLLRSFFGKHAGERVFSIKPNSWIQLENVWSGIVTYEMHKQWTRTIMNIVYAPVRQANDILVQQAPMYTERA